MRAIVHRDVMQLTMQRLAAAEHSHERPLTSRCSPITVPSNAANNQAVVDGRLHSPSTQSKVSKVKHTSIV